MTLLGWVGIALFVPSVLWAIVANLFVCRDLRSRGVSLPWLSSGLASTWYLKNQPATAPDLYRLALSANLAMALAILIAILLGRCIWPWA